MIVKELIEILEGYPENTELAVKGFIGKSNVKRVYPVDKNNMPIYTELGKEDVIIID